MCCSSKEGDNCVKLGHDVVVIKNIFQSRTGVFIMYRKFESSEPFFLYPVDSLQCDIHKVDRLGDNVHIARIQSVKCKYMLLPHHNQHIAIPVLHTMNSFV